MENESCLADLTLYVHVARADTPKSALQSEELQVSLVLWITAGGPIGSTKTSSMWCAGRVNLHYFVVGSWTYPTCLRNIMRVEVSTKKMLEVTN